MDDFLTLVFFLYINFPIYLLLSSLFLTNRDGSPLKIWQKVAQAALAIFLIVSCRYFELMWLGMVLWLRPAGIGVELCCLVALITQKLLKKNLVFQERSISVRLWSLHWIHRAHACCTRH